MEEPQVRAVLDFLVRHGFSSAAYALRDDALSRGIDIESDVNSFPLLPSVRTIPVTFRDDGDCDVAAGSTSSSGVFVSIGSSPSELMNPYGIWSPESLGSSVKNSEFGTAREYDDSSLVGDVGWYGDEFAGFFNDIYSLPANQSEDKFVMSIEAKEKFLKQDENNFDYGVKQGSCVGLGSVGVYGCSFPLCGCCKGDGDEKLSSLYTSSSIYGRYHIMDDETECLDDCGDTEVHLKRIEGCTCTLQCRSDSGGLDRERENRALDTLSGEKNLLKFSVDGIRNFAFTENNNSKIFGDANRDAMLFSWNTSELEANTGAECQNVDRDINDSESLRTGGEDGEDDDIPHDQLFIAHEDELVTFDLRIIHRKNRTGFEENKDLQIILNSIVAGRYYLTEYLGSAAFSKVVQARDLQTGADVCLKIIKNGKDFFDQSLDEIKLLKYVNKNDPSDQCHLLRLYDYFYHKEHLFIVCELLRANLYEFQKFNQDSGGDVYFTMHRIQAIARQCLEALEYLHLLKIIHCDLKPENILIKSYSRCEIKVIDLGSSRFITDNLCLYEQSRSYRAPEVILGLPYDEKIDVWSLGCILVELYTGEVLFLNESLAVMLAHMIGILGPIDVDMLENGHEVHNYFTEDYDLYYKNEETDKLEYLIPEKSSLAYILQVNDAAFLDFLHHLLQVNPKLRLTASQALRHGWFSVSYR